MKTDAVTEDLLRELAPQVLGVLVRRHGQFEECEDAVQEAVLAAAVSWPADGVPDNPRGWLLVTAKRRAVDIIRREARRAGKETEAMMFADPVPGPAEPPEVIRDDLLRLVFTCCHPALAREAQVALTLRLVCGLTTSEIAQAFLVSEPTMAARVTRAKKKISVARIAYRVPAAAELPDRLDAVLTVVHLLYTTGHTSPGGDNLVRDDLVERAIGLARMLQTLMPDEREVRGLLALFLLTDARRATRADAGGRLLLLGEQDRSRWDRRAIDEGTGLVTGALRGGRPGRFALQAAIAALHAEAPSYGDTDWPQILRLYDGLSQVWISPVVALNRAVALAMAEGPEAGLAAIGNLEREGHLTGYRYLPAAKADLLRQLGRRAEAAQAYQEALELTSNETERDFLAGRLAEVIRPAGDSGGPGGTP